MLLVVGIGAIIIATTLIVMRQQKPQKRLWVDFASYGFGAAVMSWVAVSSFVDLACQLSKPGNSFPGRISV